MNRLSAFPVLAAGEAPSGKPWFSIKAAETGPAEINIYDDIGKDWWSGEGVGGKEFAQELKNIPKDRDINVRINSRGGNVHDGMLIHNLLSERRDKVTVQVDGVALSIASVIALAGKKLIMPRNSLFMIHDPWTVAQGNASEMRAAAEMLDKHRDAMLTVYEKKTGKSADDIKNMMSSETWFTGDEAKANGFADEVTNEISLQACFDFSKFKRVPSQLRNLQNKGDTMNRKAIMARLRRLGIQFDEKATTETLNALLAENTARDKMETRAKELNVAIEANTSDRDLEILLVDAIEASDDGGDAADDDAGDDSVNRIEPEPSAAAKRTKTRSRSARDGSASARDGSLGVKAQANPELENRLKSIEAKYEAERKQRIESVVDRCISEDRVPAAQRDKWVARAVADESVLDDLRAMEPKPPGASPVGVVITSDSPQDIERGILALNKPVDSWFRGNSVDPKIIAANARSISAAVNAHRKKLNSILATNTIDPVLKRTVIMNDLMRDFKRVLLMFNVFSTKFESVPLQGTNKLAVPFYDLDTTASTDFDASTGYSFGGDTSVGVRELTINKRKYKTMDFSSDTFNRQPYFRPDTSMMLKAEQLGVDVWTDILSIITASNYGASVMDVEAGAFDSDDMVTLRKIANNTDWPTVGRACVLGTDHEAALLSDDAIKHMQNSGSNDALREGSTGRLSGFDMYYSPRIPTNSEDLAGFICLPPAALIATAPILPAPGVRQQLLRYQIITDPETGISFEYRYGADVWADKDREVVECNYGYAKGNGRALKRITAGANVFSSSSSASSVNSSSSSSSSPSF